MKILLVVSRYPWPPRRGDQLRTIQTLCALAGEHRVTLLAPEPAGGPVAPELPAGCTLACYRAPGPAGAAFGILRALWAGRPLQTGLYHGRDLRRRLPALALDADLVILQLVRLAVASDDLAAVPTIVDLIDGLSLNVGRRADLDRRWLRPLLRLEARRLETAERRLFESARKTVLVSERDRRWLLRRWELEAAQAGRLEVVPLAVERLAAERPTVEGGDPEEPGGLTRPLLALTGNLGYFVNADAASWFLAEIWPELSRRRPELRLVLAGARPSRRLRRRAAASGAELIVSPPDLRAVLAGATVALAPMRAGSGVPVKVLEAWAVGVPVVASPWAAAGTGGRAGEELLVAGTNEEWIAAILSLVDDPELRLRLSAAGRRLVGRDHSPRRVQTAWQKVLRAPESGI